MYVCIDIEMRVLGLVGSRRWPSRAFKRVDFPVLESPMMPIMAQANAASMKGR